MAPICLLIRVGFILPSILVKSSFFYRTTAVDLFQSKTNPGNKINKTQKHLDIHSKINKHFLIPEIMLSWLIVTVVKNNVTPFPLWCFNVFYCFFNEFYGFPMVFQCFYIFLMISNGFLCFLIVF